MGTAIGFGSVAWCCMVLHGADCLRVKDETKKYQGPKPKKYRKFRKVAHGSPGTIGYTFKFTCHSERTSAAPLATARGCQRSMFDPSILAPGTEAELSTSPASWKPLTIRLVLSFSAPLLFSLLSLLFFDALSPFAGVHMCRCAWAGRSIPLTFFLVLYSCSILLPPPLLRSPFCAPLSGPLFSPWAVRVLPPCSPPLLTSSSSSPLAFSLPLLTTSSLRQHFLSI